MPPVLTALVGMVTLGVVMGIGRFVFTPILPMMLGDRLIDLPSAAWLASVNYAGYLLGALACTLQPWLWRRMSGLPALPLGRLVRAGLVVTVLTTAAMALPWPALWGPVRFVAGVATAVAFIYTAGWCLARLTAFGAGAIGGLIYAGPGLGIAVTGLAGGGLASMGVHSATAWAGFAVLAAIATVLVWRLYGGRDPRLGGGRAAAPGAGEPGIGGARTGGLKTGAVRTAAEKQAGSLQIGFFALAYGLAGFGYIITATFAPVIARAAMPGSPWIDFFWPLFGVGSVIGALVATRVSIRRDLRRWLAAAYVVQAVGIVVPLAMPSLAGFVAGSLLLGLPFTVITFLAVQEAQRLKPVDTPSLIGVLTACYGAGQIIGPPLTGWLVARAPSIAIGFDRALGVAAVALLLGGLIFVALRWRWPGPVEA